MNPLESKKMTEGITVDWTHFSIGCETSRILQEDESLREAKNTFRLISQKSDKKMAVLFPAVVIPSDLTYRYQLPVIAENFGTVVSVDYSSNSFSSPLLRAQIRDFFNSSAVEDKLITPIALCFGTCWIIDFLANASEEERKKIDKLILLGALDRYTGMRGPDTYKDEIKGKFVAMARRGYGGDPLEKPAIRKSLVGIPTDTIISRYMGIGNVKPVSEIQTFENMRALLIWWEDDFLKPEDSQEKVERLFKNPTSSMVSGSHGWTATSAEEINTHMAAFLQKT